jgi:hypothetical protein
MCLNPRKWILTIPAANPPEGQLRPLFGCFISALAQLNPDDFRSAYGVPLEYPPLKAHDSEPRTLTGGIRFAV